MFRIAKHYSNNFDADVARAKAYDVSEIHAAMKDNLVDAMPVEDVDVID